MRSNTRDCRGWEPGEGRDCPVLVVPQAAAAAREAGAGDGYERQYLAGMCTIVRNPGTRDGADSGNSEVRQALPLARRGCGRVRYFCRGRIRHSAVANNVRACLGSRLFKIFL